MSNDSAIKIDIDGTRFGVEGSLKKFELHAFPDEDWTRRCLDSFKPMSFGNRKHSSPTF